MSGNTRFSERDLRKGNVLDNSIKEMLKNIVKTVDPKLLNDASVVRDLNKLISKFIKEVKLYKTSPGNEKDTEEKEEATEYFEDLKRFNSKWFACLNRMNFDLIRFHLNLIKKKKHDLIDYLLYLREKLSRLRTESLIVDFEEFERAKERGLQDLRKLYLMQTFTIERLDELYLNRNNLIQSITEYEVDIKVSRNYHAANAAKYFAKVEVGGLKTCEGMSQAQINKLSHDMFAIHETRNKILMRIERNIQKEKQSEIVRTGASSMQEISTIESNIRRQYQKQIDKVNNDFIPAIQRAGDASGCKHIGTNVPESEKHINALLSNANIRQEFESHEQNVKEKYPKILDNKEELVEVKKAIKEETVEFKKTVDSINQNLDHMSVNLGSQTTQVEKQKQKALVDAMDAFEDFDFDSDMISEINPNAEGLNFEKQTDVELNEEDRALAKCENLDNLIFSKDSISLKSDQEISSEAKPTQNK